MKRGYLARGQGIDGVIVKMYRAHRLKILVGLKFIRFMLLERMSWKYKRKDSGMLDLEVLLMYKIQRMKKMRVLLPCMFMLVNSLTLRVQVLVLFSGTMNMQNKCM